MAELARRQLAQRHVVKHVDVIRTAQRVRLDQTAQPREGRVMHEILVHPERHAGRHRLGHQRRGGSGAGRQRLLQQHRLAGGQQLGGDRRVQIRRDQHMRPIERFRRKGRAD